MAKKIWSDEDISFLKDNWFEPMTWLAKSLEIGDEKIIRRKLSELGYERPVGKMDNMRLRARLYREKSRGLVPDEWFCLPLTRQDAKAVNSPWFWNGQPCQRGGHLSRRKTSSGGCWACEYGDHKEKMKSPDFRKIRNRSFFRWYTANKEVYLENQRNRFKGEKHKQWARLYRQRLRENTEYRISKSLRDRLYKAVKHQDSYKDESAAKLVGCTTKELMDHLQALFQEGMSWDNYGEWHIDHIRPCISFDMKDSEQQKVCFDWRNLQPLWSDKNISKLGRYDELSEDLWVKRMRSLGYEGELFLRYINTDKLVD